MASLVEVQVLEREQEALYSFVASMNAFRYNLALGDKAMVIDQGGGSVELSCGLFSSDGITVLEGYDSLSLGTVRLTRLFAEAGTLNHGYDLAVEDIRHEVDRHRRFAALSSKSPAAVFALGSGISSLAERMSPKRGQEGKSLRHLHGQYIDSENIQQLAENTGSRLSAVKRAPSVDLDVDSDVITLLSGLLTYYYILQKYRAPGVTVSRHGLRYGVLLSLAGQPCLTRLVPDVEPTSKR